MKKKTETILTTACFLLGIGIFDAYVSRGAIAVAVGNMVGAGVQSLLVIILSPINAFFGAAMPAITGLIIPIGSVIIVGYFVLFLLVPRMLDAMKPAKKEEPKKKGGGGGHHTS